MKTFGNENDSNPSAGRYLETEIPPIQVREDIWKWKWFIAWRLERLGLKKEFNILRML
jgi:hypothetical protein